MKVDAKTNEITVTPELIKALELKGCIITVDALNTQKKTTEAIIDAGADYILPVKENHKELLAEIKLTFNDAESKKYKGVDADNTQTTDIGHGRYEVREYFLLDAEDFPAQSDWPGLQTLGKVVRRRHTQRGSEYEEVYYILSTEMDAALFARGVRGHWGIENGLHWSLDVIFREDCSRYRENLSAIRKMVLGMLKQERVTKAGIKA